jgi:hypothetical protein
MSDAPSPREFGQLEERVRALDSKFGVMNDKLAAIDEKMDELTRLAERGKGAYWGALGLASTVGALVTWVIKTFSGKVPTP